jgi:hypothetical protein
MSTRSGKPSNPIDLSAYEPRMARQLSATERLHSEDETDPLRSAYPPKRAQEPAGTERLPVEKDRDALRSPFAPTKARGQPAVAPDFVISDGAEPPAPMRAWEGSRERPAAERQTLGADEPHRYVYDTSGLARALARPLSNDRDDHSPKTALEEGITGGHPVDRDAAASFQPVHPSSGRHQPPAAERRDEIMSDHDLKRLEASLRWLQRQEAATRLPRAASLPSVPGLAPVDPTRRHHSSEMPVDSLRAPRSLEPERLAPPPPMRSRRDNLRWPLAIVVASIFAAPVAYYLLVGGWGAPPALEPQTASFDQTIVAPQESAPIEMSSERTGISQIGRSSEGGTATMLQGGITGTQAPSPGKANRSLDREEIKLLTKQGEQFAGAGDLVTARILFQRAAEAGEATAAMALGATYDPNVLAKLGVAGMGADVEKARSWYRKAESQGSAEATQRLHALANR